MDPARASVATPTCISPNWQTAENRYSDNHRKFVLTWTSKP
jgi:hypothetical protein